MSETPSLASRLTLSPRHIPGRSLFVARAAAYFSVSGGPKVDLASKGPLRRIFQRLVEAHREQPLRGLTVAEVWAAGWPGEVTVDPAGRVYSGISKLRRLGLADVVRRSDAGYQLDPRVCVLEEVAVFTRLAS
ncbi:MAG: Signal transduction response regulator [Labilithrix sp.]|nr:Signal transduction response regulator [Labilithrix sp.]